MRVLLDTHTVLWWLAGEERFSSRARSIVADEDNSVYVSAASAWEVSTKVRLGKLPGGEAFAAEFDRHVRHQGFIGLDITLAHGQRAGALPGPHRDPFDRMLVAQAHSENLVLISNDRVFDSFGVARIW